jgi:hypothetical protein
VLLHTPKFHLVLLLCLTMEFCYHLQVALPISRPFIVWGSPVVCSSIVLVYPHHHLSTARKAHSNDNLVQVPRHGHCSCSLLHSVLAGCQGEAHLLPKAVPACLCENKLDPTSNHLPRAIGRITHVTRENI